MLKKLAALCLAALMTLALVPAGVFAAGGTLSGSGTEEAPYLIEDAEDWNTFAAGFTDSINYSNVWFRLTNDISVTTRAGDGSHAFCGSFDGGGHTLTVSYGTASSWVTTQYWAPFGCINGAEIKRLGTAGTIYTNCNNSYASGLVGKVSGGDNAIISCRSSVTIRIGWDASNASNGGLVGHCYSGSLSMTDCLFDGKIIKINTGIYCGGFVGFAAYAPTLKNCLYAPAALGAGETEPGSSCTFVYPNSNATALTNCYYTRMLDEYSATQGTAVGSMTAAQLKEALGGGWEVVNGNVVPVTDEHYLGTASVNVNAENSTYLYTGSAQTVAPVVRDAEFHPLTAGTDYTYSITDLNGDSVAEVVNKGTYTLTVNGIGAYTGIITAAFRVDGNGSADNPYEIYTADDWDAFVSNHNSGAVEYSGKLVLLKNDITVSSCVGTSSQNFSGVFNGNGHTITYSRGEELTLNTAGVFAYIQDAFIINLHVTGSGSTNAYYVTGFIGNAYGSENRVLSCRSSFNVTSNGSGTKVAGFVGNINSNARVVFYNCLFDGSVDCGTTSGRYAAGFVGSIASNGNVFFSNCYSNGVVKATSAYPFAKANIFPDRFENCWYKVNSGSSYNSYQGSDVGDMKNEEILSELGTGWMLDGGGNVVPNMRKTLDNATVSGVNKYYRYTGSNITVDEDVTVTDAEGVVAERVYDYGISITCNGEPVSVVREKGVYVMNITPEITSVYSGSTSVSFKVGDAPETPANLGIDSGIDFDDYPDSYFYLNMPADNTAVTVEATAQQLTDGLTGFKVYDDGGKNGNYTVNAAGILNVTVPEGYVVKLSGTLDVGYGAALSVYDGSTETEPILRITEDAVIDAVYSTGRDLRIGFTTSDESAAGLNLTVNIVRAGYAVSFDMNAVDAAGSMAGMYIPYGDTQALTANAFTREGWIFDGWNTQADGLGNTYADGASVRDLTSGHSITLYAMWRRADAPVFSGCEIRLRIRDDEDMSDGNKLYFMLTYSYNGHSYLHNHENYCGDGAYDINRLYVRIHYSIGSFSYTYPWQTVTNIYDCTSTNFTFTVLISGIPDAYTGVVFEVDSYIEYNDGNEQLHVSGTTAYSSVEQVPNNN